MKKKPSKKANKTHRDEIEKCSSASSQTIWHWCVSPTAFYYFFVRIFYSPPLHCRICFNRFSSIFTQAVFTFYYELNFSRIVKSTAPQPNLPYCTRAFSIILPYFYFFNSTVDLYHVFFFIVSGHFINHFFIFILT